MVLDPGADNIHFISDRRVLNTVCGLLLWSHSTATYQTSDCLRLEAIKLKAFVWKLQILEGLSIFLSGASIRERR